MRPHTQHDHNLLGIEDEFYAIKADLPERICSPQSSSSSTPKTVFSRKKLNWDKFKIGIVIVGIVSGLPLAAYTILAIILMISSIV